MIGIIDSGIGGFEILDFLHKRMSCDVFYYADSANFPYGSKTPAQMIAILQDIFNYMHKLKIFQIVLACNTASFIYQKNFEQFKTYGMRVVDMTQLLRQFDCTENTVLCTQLSAMLVEENNFLKNAKIHSLPNLAAMIEHNSIDDIKHYLQKNLPNSESFVYGCTHFPLVHGLFVEAAPNVIFKNIAFKIKDFVNISKKDGAALKFYSSCSNYDIGEKYNFFQKQLESNWLIFA